MLCIYDNPITRTRQAWIDGELESEYTPEPSDFTPLKIHFGSIGALGLPEGEYLDSIAEANGLKESEQ